MRVVVLALCLVASSFAVFQSFEDGLDSWVKSKTSKPGVAEDIAKYNGEWEVIDGRLTMTKANRHYGLSTSVEPSFSFADQERLVMQYEVKFEKSMECGGSYVKLLSATDDLDLEQLNDKTPYTILFGPDKCGADSHLRFIYRFKNPVTDKYAEVHMNKVDNANTLFTTGKTHLVRLVINKDNSFAVYGNDKIMFKGQLPSEEHFDPALEPPVEIDDPEDKKPSDWVDEPMMDDPEDEKPEDWDEDAPMTIPDPDATKPEDWDEDAPVNIPDPEAEKPEDWDDEEDGEWEAPMIPNPRCDEGGCGKWTRPTIPNPAYKGKWKPKQIANPDYKGVWAPRKIPNPEHFTEKDPYSHLDSIGAVAFELWTITAGVSFDNVYLGSRLEEADELKNTHWKPIRDEEDAQDASEDFISKAQSFLMDVIEQANDQPYLYIVFTVGLAIVIAVVMGMLNRGGSEESEETVEEENEEENSPENEETEDIDQVAEKDENEGDDSKDDDEVDENEQGSKDD